MSFRIGQGFDIHPLVPGRRLVLAGVEIPSERGLAGHSDADAALHALTDALLGAIGAGDIGRHYPDADPRHADRSSVDFVRETMAAVRARGYRVANADVTILAEEPQLAPYLDRMRANVADLLGVSSDAANVKATRGEGLGAIGRAEGIAAQALGRRAEQAFAMNPWIGETAHRLRNGTDELTTYEFNTGAAKHHFCRHCGIHSFYVPRSDPDKIDVNVRCLDGVDIAAVRVTGFDGRHWEESMAGRVPWR